jgi:hypothetical protein
MDCGQHGLRTAWTADSMDARLRHDTKKPSGIPLGLRCSDAWMLRLDYVQPNIRHHDSVTIISCTAD